MKNRIRLTAFLFFLISTCMTNFAAGQSTVTDEVSFHVSISSPIMQHEDGFTVDFVITDNTSEQKAIKGDFSPPQFHGFRVLKGPNITSMTTVYGGVVKRTKTYNYIMVADQLGEQQILPGSLSFFGDTLYTKTADVQVLAQTISSDSIPFIQAKISMEEAYIGQRVWLEYIYYSTKEVPRGVTPLNKGEYPFFRESLYSEFDADFETETINGINYYVVRLRKMTLFPQVTGTLVIPPQEFLIYGTSIEYLVLRSDSIVLEVQDYPSPVPLSFRGAVDVVELSMEQKTAVNIDGWREVEIKLWTNGDLTRANIPDLGIEEDHDESNIYSIKDIPNLLDRSESSKRLITYWFDDQININDLHPEITYFDTRLGEFMRCNLGSTNLPLSMSVENNDNEPEKTGNEVEENTDSLSEMHDLVLVIDVSSSMLTQDFQPNRIEFIKNHLIQQLVTKPENARVGVVAFSGNAITVCPLTRDLEELQSAINELEVDMLIDGTSHGHGIISALNLMKKSASRHQSILMISDGVNNINFMPPLAAAACARRMGVRVHTSVIGSENEALTPIAKTPADGYRYALKTAELDTASLVEIAEITGGEFQLISNSINTEINFQKMTASSSEPQILSDHPMYNIIEGQSVQNLNLWLNAFEMEKFKILAD